LPKAFAGAEHSEIATTFREGPFRYRIPLTDDAHTVTLTFMEPKAKLGEHRCQI
jgi:hypothetical protein